MSFWNWLIISGYMNFIIKSAIFILVLVIGVLLISLITDKEDLSVKERIKKNII